MASYFYDLVDNRKKWKQGLTDNNLLAFYKGGLKVFYFFENNPIPMRAVENHVNRYIGRDWYGE
jgi:hypothetical protein